MVIGDSSERATSLAQGNALWDRRYLLIPEAPTGRNQYSKTK
jgi:hypothetical protein